jgi:hypothetical protein
MRFASQLSVVQKTTHPRWNTAHGAGNRNCVFGISVSYFHLDNLTHSLRVEVSNLGHLTSVADSDRRRDEL